MPYFSHQHEGNTMSDEAKFIYDELRKEGYGLLIDKRDYGAILGWSLSTIDNNIKHGMNIPNYKKLGITRNAKVMFNLRDVAEFIVAHTIQTPKV